MFISITSLNRNPLAERTVRVKPVKVVFLVAPKSNGCRLVCDYQIEAIDERWR